MALIAGYRHTIRACRACRRFRFLAPMLLAAVVALAVRCDATPDGGPPAAGHTGTVQRSLALLSNLQSAIYNLQSASAPRPGMVSSPEPDWPQWRGRHRNGISDEKGLLPSWPPEGPKLLWKVSGLGTGWSSPIVVRKRLYIAGDAGSDLVIHAFDLQGKPVWQVKNGAAWKGHYPGARASLAYASGRLYHMNAHGRVACLDPADGREFWAVDILDRFKGENITWAMSECLLVDRGRVFVTPGGTGALMAALDAKTGKTLWASDPIPGDKAVYTSPILFRFGARRILANCSSSHGFGVDADTGKLLWKVPVQTQHRATTATPHFADGSVFYVAPDGPDGVRYQLTERAGGVDATPLWKTTLDTLTGAVIVVGDKLFGCGYRRTRSWHCLDWRTGRDLYRRDDLTKGAAVYADGLLYCLAEDGTAALLRPTETEFQVAGRFKLTDAKPRDAWAHPVLLDGRLYYRYHDTLWCYDVRK